MANQTKILSELSKIAVDAMSTFSGLRKEIETIVKLRVERAINKMKLVRRDEFEVLKKMVQQLILQNKKMKKKPKKSKSPVRKKKKNKIIKR